MRHRCSIVWVSYLMLLRVCEAFFISSSPCASSNSQILSQRMVVMVAAHDDLQMTDDNYDDDTTTLAGNPYLDERDNISNNNNNNNGMETMSSDDDMINNSFFPSPTGGGNMDGMPATMDLSYPTDEDLKEDVTELQATVEELASIVSILHENMRVVAQERDEAAQHTQLEQDEGTEDDIQLKNTFSRILENQVEMSKQLGLSIVEMKMMQEQQGEFLRVKSNSDREMSKMVTLMSSDMRIMKLEMKESRDDHSSMEERMAALEQKLAARQEIIAAYDDESEFPTRTTHLADATAIISHDENVHRKTTAATLAQELAARQESSLHGRDITTSEAETVTTPNDDTPETSMASTDSRYSFFATKKKTETEGI